MVFIRHAVAEWIQRVINDTQHYAEKKMDYLMVLAKEMR